MDASWLDKLNDQQRQQIVQAFAEAFTTRSPGFRYTLLASLRERGEAAKPMLPAIEKLANGDAPDLLRRYAQETADHIRGKSATEAPDLKQLREEIDRLKREQESLRERLNKYEKSGKK